MIITSLQNPLVKKLISLRDAKTRRENLLAVIDGCREVLRAKEAGVAIESIIYCPALLPHADAINALSDRHTQYIEVNAKVFEKIAYGERLDGVIAVAKIKPLRLKDLKLSTDPLVVVVDGLEKPGNLGAILRTCDGAGVDALLIADTKTDIYNPNVIRASIATVFTVPVVAAPKEDIAAFLSDKGIALVGAFVQAKDSYTKINLKKAAAIILGQEDKGLSEFWQKQCQHKVRIPMKGKADSLNVSVSAAVIIYEALRQRS